MDWSAEPWASLVGFLTGEATQGEWLTLTLVLTQYEWMDVLWSLEVRIVMHRIGIYGCFFFYFFRHLFRKCNGSFAGEGAKPPPQTHPQL